jgi:hypothetical protein
MRTLPVLLAFLTPPSSPANKKRSRTYDLSIPSKKDPGSPIELNFLSVIVQNPSLSFSPGSSEKIPARALFKVARKGKKKLVSTVEVAEDDSTMQGGCLKHL